MAIRNVAKWNLHVQKKCFSNYTGSTPRRQGEGYGPLRGLLGSVWLATLRNWMLDLINHQSDAAEVVLCSYLNSELQGVTVVVEWVYPATWQPYKLETELAGKSLPQESCGLKFDGRMKARG